MNRLESLLKKEKLSPGEIDLLIREIKVNLWPLLVQQGRPKNCGDCALSRACRLVDKNLICPWLV
ncbi:MAG: hypothetical protein PHD09_05255 [Candidatus Omnitrophica bacterium]|nr:hypothetical protein [Candidatus Omnitrophota bacterium]